MEKKLEQARKKGALKAKLQLGPTFLQGSLLPEANDELPNLPNLATKPPVIFLLWERTSPVEGN